METLNRTMSNQTEKLIKGLELMVQAREYILTSFTDTYGEEEGGKMYADAYEKDMDCILLSIKVSIGDSMEVNMSDLKKNEF